MKKDIVVESAIVCIVALIIFHVCLRVANGHVFLVVILLTTVLVFVYWDLVVQAVAMTTGASFLTVAQVSGRPLVSDFVAFMLVALALILAVALIKDKPKVSLPGSLIHVGVLYSIVVGAIYGTTLIHQIVSKVL